MNKAAPIIIKFGTGILAEPGGCSLDHLQIQRLVAEIAVLIKQGQPCVIVSSGAIAAGVHSLGLKNRPDDVAGKQACAAVGQPMLMARYAQEFLTHGINTAQLLLTHEDIYTESRRFNAQATLHRLLASPNVIPIINENDSVAVEELRLGDNDQLSSEVAVMMKAQLLMLLTSTDGLMTTSGDTPHQRIPEVTNLQEVLCHVTPEKGEHSTGGMTTKLKAVELATTAGIITVIANGRTPLQISKALAGEDTGTRFLI